MIVAASDYFLHFFVNASCHFVDTPSMLHPQKDLESVMYAQVWSDSSVMQICFTNEYSKRKMLEGLGQEIQQLMSVFGSFNINKNRWTTFFL